MRIALILLLAIAGQVSGQSAEPSDSSRIEAIFDGYFRDFITLNPESGTQLGLARASGYSFDRGGLNDLSDAGIKANSDLNKRYVKLLDEIDTTHISRQQRIDAAILHWWLRLQIEGDRFIDHKYAIDHLFGVHSSIVSLMTEYHTIETQQDILDYLSRLERIPVRIRQECRRIERQESQSIRPSASVIGRFIGSIEEFVAAKPTENILVASFETRLGAVTGIDPAQSRKLLERAAEIVEKEIYPAYTELFAAARLSLANADSVGGVWKLPNGDEYYRYCLKSFLTTPVEPDELFRLGEKQVAHLQKLGRSLLDSLGISGDKPYGELVREYWEYQKKPEIADIFAYPDTPEKRKLILADYTSILRDATARLPEAFAYVPKTPAQVLPVPEYKEQGGLTYYEPASLDGKRPATFYINMLSPLAKPSMRSLTYHETVPGHHYQLAVQQELTEKRMFKNLYFLSGFGEGWAMYCEDLAAELGWLPDIYSRLAENNSQLFRAVRVVADVGLHSRKWTRDQTLQYFKDNLGWSSETEIDRYSVWPGQAPSYNYGKLKIQELREKARQQLGPKFDLKAFHMVVVENGSVPLELLERMVEDYVARAR
jgi:uncharacterized protein (DUF885 family)